MWDDAHIDAVMTPDRDGAIPRRWLSRRKVWLCACALCRSRRDSGIISMNEV
jgi:hypothetical protein